jgi:hypothetical protein
LPQNAQNVKSNTGKVKGDCRAKKMEEAQAWQLTSTRKAKTTAYRVTQIIEVGGRYVAIFSFI